jgi:uncharacterized membrane protein
MNISTFVTLYLLSVPVFMAIDFIWLGFVAKGFYAARIGHLMGEINWPAAVLFYGVFLLGLTFFATYPAVEKNSWMTALILGGLFGFFTYATYDLTNLATLKGWPVSLVIVDILWGTILGASVAFFACIIKQTYL